MSVWFYINLFARSLLFSSEFSIFTILSKFLSIVLPAAAGINFCVLIVDSKVIQGWSNYV